MGEAPDYLICLDCESPCYIFEWVDGEISEVICEVCGADSPDEFMTEDDYEGMMSAEGSGRGA